MQTTPNNKMIGADQETTKTKSQERREVVTKKATKLKKFYFPVQKKTVEAATLEEAITKLNNQEKQ